MILSVAFLVSCQGDPGPMGPAGYDGQDGQDGTNILGIVFETDAYNFSFSNDFLLYYAFPNDVEIYDTDIVVVYVLWEQDNGLDVWRALPQSVFFNEGTMMYNFDYTAGDVQIFIDGTMDPNLLPSGYTDDQIFRIVVLPADWYNNKSVDLNDYNAVMKALNKEVEPVKGVQLYKR